MPFETAYGSRIADNGTCFFIILTGFLFTRWRQPRIDLIGKINIELFAPVLLIYVLSEKLPALNEIGPIIIAGLVVVLGSGLLVWSVLKLYKLDVRLILPPVMFNNSGNLGLPLAVFAFGEKALPWAVLRFLSYRSCCSSLWGF